MSLWDRLWAALAGAARNPTPDLPKTFPAAPAPAPRVLRHPEERFDFDAIRPLFDGRLTQPQVEGIKTILAAASKSPITHKAYLLATAFHETARTMQPVRETLAATDELAVNRLERAWQAGKLPSVRTPYWRFDDEGKTWLGRGYVQLTHKKNYARAGKELNVDLLGNPTAAMNPTVAALILVRGSEEGWFTGKRLADYLPGNYVGARRVINGLDRAKLIAAQAEAFERALS